MLNQKGKIVRFKHIMKKLETDEVVSETILVGLHIDTIKRKGVPVPEFVSLNSQKKKAD